MSGDQVLKCPHCGGRLAISISGMPLTDEELLIQGTSVDDLAISVRTANCLKNMKIKTIAEASAVSDHEYLRNPNFGKTSLAQLRQQIDAWRREQTRTKLSEEILDEVQ